MYNELSMSNVVNAPVDLRDRTLVFARDVIRFVRPYQRDPLARPIVSQLIRSSSSIGANFVEAKNASSKKDFRNKVFISKKEAWFYMAKYMILFNKKLILLFKIDSRLYSRQL